MSAVLTSVTINMVVAKEVDRQTWQMDLGGYDTGIYIAVKWIDALVEVASKPIYINFTLHGEIVGKVSGIVINGSLLQGNQLYFYSGPALREADNMLYQHCLDAIRAFALQKRYTRISIRPWDQINLYVAQASKYRKTETYEYEIDLQQNYGESSISSRILRNIKKARKLGATIRESSSVDDLNLLLSFLKSTHTRRATKFGTDYSPFYIYKLNEDVLAGLLGNGMAKLYCAEVDNQVQSILLMLDSAPRTYNLLKGSTESAYVNGTSSFVDFEVVKIYQQRGFHVFNLGLELTELEGTGLNLYKEGIGGTRIKKLGAYTYYLFFPYRILNLLFLINGMVPNNKWIVKVKRKLSALFAGASK